MRAVAVLLALVLAWPADATVTGVSTAPTVRNVALGQAASVPLVWSVSLAGVGAGIRPSVSSPGGTFRAGSVTGPVLGTVPRTLSRAVSGPVAALSFRETVLVPARVTKQAHRLGADRIFYVRTFDDGAGSASGAIQLPITGSGATPLTVSRVALSFASGSVLEVVRPGAPVRVRARLMTTGSGLLRAVWELADPSSTAGKPVFRPVHTVRRYLAGSGEHVLDSPLLPSRRAGSYLVRLRLTDPAPGFALPQLRYFVNAGSARGMSPLQVSAPAPGARLGPATRFRWRPVRGAQAYLLELLPAAPARTEAPAVVAGAVIPAGQHELELSPATRQRLVPGRRYRWRVRAIGADGRTLAESAPRELEVP